MVIETPHSSRNKYSYDPDCDCMQLSTVLLEGLVFPEDFGFVSSPLGQNGDPLILMDEPVVPGCVVRARLIGAVQAEQKEKGEGWTRNDRLIALRDAGPGKAGKLVKEKMKLFKKKRRP
jgi:inorganic pyrophosphatase